MLKNKRYLLVAVSLALTFLLPDMAGATQLTQAGVRLGRLGTSAGSGGAGDKNDLLVTFKLNTTPTSVSKIKVCFTTNFTIAAGSPVVGSTFPNTPASITAPPGLPATGTAVASDATCPGSAGSIVISGLTSASLVGTTLYGFTVAAGTITNPSSTGQYNVTVSSENVGATVIDTTTTPIFITTSAAGDQVTVTASVAPNFSFSLSANSDTVPQVNPTSISTSTGVTMTVGTNSPLGYTAYVKSLNGSLISPSTSTPISTGTFDGAADTVTAGTSDYGFVPTTGAAPSTVSGTLTYDGEYSNGSGGPIVSATKAGSFNGSNNFASFVSRNGYTNADQILLQERVAVANTIGYANNYADTLTVVAAGNF
jgi:hypothetical protein